MTDKSKESSSSKLLYCSFCGKSQHEVRKLIAGPSVYICDECVDLCNDIIREEIKDACLEKAESAFQNAISINPDNIFRVGVLLKEESLPRGSWSVLIGNGDVVHADVTEIEVINEER